MNILDHISESLETIFGVKIHKFFDANADPGIFLTLAVTLSLPYQYLSSKDDFTLVS